MAALRALGSIAILVLGASSACRPEGGGGTEGARAAVSLSPEDVARIRSADSAFMAAANAGDADGVAAVYAEEGSLLAPNLPPQKGRAAIKAFWGGFLDA